MKRLMYIGIMLFCFGCNSEETIKESLIDTTTPQLSALDVWLRENYVAPYNIEVLYKWEDNQVEKGRYLYPPSAEKVQPLMEVVLHIWIDSYTQLGGEDFIKKLAPRQIVLVGGYNVNPSGTITLGLADSGNKVTLFNVNQLDLKDKETLRRFFKTIQHEYCHILNQTKAFTEEYGKINPEGFDGDWHLTSPEDALEQGFITPYAKSNATEDFAEMVSTLLTLSHDEYEAVIASIENDEAVSEIREKEAIVVDYFFKEWGIDIYEMQNLNYEKLVVLTQ